MISGGFSRVINSYFHHENEGEVSYPDFDGRIKGSTVILGFGLNQGSLYVPVC